MSKTKQSNAIGTPKIRDSGLIIAVTMTVIRATTLPVTRDKDNKKIAKTTAN